MSGNVFIKDDNPDWKDCETLEDWVRKALREGRDEQVVTLIKILPEASREKYRKIWKEFKEQQRAESNHGKDAQP